MTRTPRHLALSLLAACVAFAPWAAAQPDAHAAPTASAPAAAPAASEPDAPGTNTPARASAKAQGIGAGGASEVGDTYIVSFKPGTSSKAGAATAERVGADVVRPLDRVFSGAIVQANQAEASALAKRPDVAKVTPDRVISGAATTQANPPSWGLDRIDQTSLPLSKSYTYTPSGRGVTAYMIDSGINPNHNEFGGRVLPGVYVTDVGSNTLDCHGHGTHTAGTVGGATVGVAKSVSLVPVRVLDCNNRGTVSGFIAGIDWVIGQHQAGQPAVANMSVGADSISTELDAAVAALIKDGVSVSVSAGNDSRLACNQSPARVPAAITVGATTETDVRADFSNYGSCLDLFAPGEDITSAYNGNNTSVTSMSGTSMAAPHVTGAAALYLEGHRSATPAAVRDALVAQATTGKVTDAKTGSPNRLLKTSGITAAAAAGTYWPVEPRRILDTRVSNAKVAPNSSATLQVTGRGGIPTTGVAAVVLNVTVTQPAAAGNITAYPTGAAKPSASNLNFVAGQTIPNLVTVRLGSGGRVTLANNSGGSSHLIADVAGYYVSGTPTAAGTFASLNPARILDTRTGAAVPANGVRGVQVAGRGGVPASGVGAVVMNVTVTQPRAAGNITAYPGGTTAPSSSNLNFVGGQTIPNLVVVRVGSNGQVNLKNNSSGTSHLIADVAGYYRAGTPTVPGSFVALDPARVLDTRSGTPLAARATGAIQVTGRGGVPASGVLAPVMNLTVTQPKAAGNLTAFPNGTAEPTASNLNFVANQTIPNLAITKIGVSGRVAAKNNSPATLHLIADVFGYVRS
jgi:subtilisin family serine protease